MKPLFPSEHTPPACASPPKKVLLLGLGNDLLGDDAVGLNVARHIRSRLSEHDRLEVRESSEMGLSLLDLVAGFDELVLVDAVVTGQATPGFVHQLEESDLPVLPQGSPHFLGIGELLALGRRLGLTVPRRARIFAVEVKDPFTVRVGLSEPVRQAFPAVVEYILRAARELAGGQAAQRSQK
jgi:hydrogenase maturation protease